MLKNKLYKLLIDELKKHANSFNSYKVVDDMQFYILGRIHQILDLIRTIFKCETFYTDGRVDDSLKIITINIYNMKNREDEVYQFYKTNGDK